ncbi:MAG: DNA polymerase III subunit epsilon [Gammaproteobacteria bacterium]|nr:MAG: DNA polymerase III subunit epsilon [Gammaproteobacteria bacterium]RLA53936.1 MAG: DNA polymerase III subunit epsilon [Gammaproteobacteria bacterium]
MRQVVLDTETTGLEWSQDHRIIEIGCVELVNRRLTNNHFHRYINPEREIDAGAMEVHGITHDDLEGKPVFKAIADEFLEFVSNAELIIHNAPFDVGFINHEFARMGRDDFLIESQCAITDTLVLARQLHPGQRNSLDALCKRYHVDNSQRTLHGALLDAEILTDVYLLMTGGQGDLSLGGENSMQSIGASRSVTRLDDSRQPLKVLYADDAELAAHRRRVMAIESASGKPGLWHGPPESNK